MSLRWPSAPDDLALLAIVVQVLPLLVSVPASSTQELVLLQLPNT